MEATPHPFRARHLPERSILVCFEAAMRPQRLLRPIVLVIGIVVAAPGPGRGPAAAQAPDVAAALPPPADRTIDYAKEVRPILAKSCYACHGPEKQKSDLRLDRKEAAFRGGAEGPS